MPLPAPSANIALFIDADNAPAAKINFIIGELASYGVVNIRRAYGNWKKPELAGWESVLHDKAIRPIQQFDLIKGKNAADMALLIDAMDTLYTKNAEVFCIVSSDSDFTPLVTRLRAEGKTVIGFGTKKAAEPFANSCSKFLYLDEEPASKDEKPPRAKRPGKELKGDTKLMNTLRTAVRSAMGESDWANLAVVGTHIANQGSFDPRNHGYSKLSDLLKAIDVFETKYVKDDNGGTHFVRLRSKG
ncbi:NYN domain-containing protein [Actomonas aquatica]|uniref:NYN domain-containing protein n=1 Tax=Actomonas aquatica TaxID=2866162 RepID=A0ABZ1CCS8_9BACT|nr:NYN domain-containing protein [Opitutus sp. WL0086]WRQ88419.1 NYN domain-containing protein [Opitutus sp. WL0086]